MKKGALVSGIILFLVSVILVKHALAALSDSSSGTIDVFVEWPPYNISLSSPQNTTYDNTAKTYPFLIDINNTSNFTASAWWYTLTDIRHDNITYENISFSPNVTINASRWTNKLVVYANDTDNRLFTKTIYFEVNQSNTSPVFGNMTSQLFACESSEFNYEINATDPDEDNLTLSVSPSNLFNLEQMYFYGETEISTNLYFGSPTGNTPNKTHIGNHSRTLTVRDDLLTTDSKSINITVIEINNPPEFTPVGVQTVWLNSTNNNTFYNQVEVTDIEDGNQYSGNLTFNITFISGTALFDINQSGVMNFTPNSSHIGNYNIQVCATDLGIDSIHPNISLCSQNGLNQSNCSTFQLTITDENQNVSFLSYYPTSLNFIVSGTATTLFNISTYDADGTIPDARWYVDSVLKEYDSGDLIETFSHSFGCGVSGLHYVEVNITDGISVSSLKWNVTVQNVACSSSNTDPPGGGGGGGGTPLCTPKWGCYDWNVCQNAESSFRVSAISELDYQNIKINCTKKSFSQDNCGFQLRTCYDSNLCNRTVNKPSELQDCQFSENPSCVDGIKNCHDDECEVLVDCGGPCPACPSCTDNTQNQGEAGIDCGGPCPWSCPAEYPYRSNLTIIFTLLVILLLLLVIIFIKIAQIVKIRKEIKREFGLKK
jgi:hypothetical protein